MTQGLRRHDEIVRSAIEQAGGYVFKTVGDAFCAAFATAECALAAVLTAQRALTAQRWPTSELHMLYAYDLADGRLTQARTHLDAAITAAESLGDELYLYFFREDLAVLLLIEGKPGQAAPL